MSLSCNCLVRHSISAREAESLSGYSVAFLYRRAAQNWGSVVNRSIQMADLLQAFDRRLNVVSTSVEEFVGTADAIIVSKTVANQRGSKRVMKKLGRRSGRLLFDLVDGHPSITSGLERHITAYICASEAEFQYRLNHSHPAFLIRHMVDSRIKKRPSIHDKFRVGYAGLKANAAHLIELEIEAFDASSSLNGANFAALESFLNSLTHHYSVRSYKETDGFKPSLKAFIAAHLGAVFVGSKSDEESLLLLGSSYPYLSDNSSLPAVKETVDFARMSFGTSTHERALNQMLSVRPLFCPAAVIAELHRAITGSSS